MKLISLFFLSLLGVHVSTQGYIVPEATIEILHPKGFKVSIPDDGEIKLFAFHGNINEEFEGREAGQFARDITLARNGRWTFTDKNTRFKEGDIIYYWLYVINKDGLGYLREHEHYKVTNIPKNDGNKDKQPPLNVITLPTSPPSTTTSEPAVCYETPTKINGASTCSGKLIFTEEFENLYKWQKEIRFAGDPDYEFVTYINDPDNLYLRDGRLYIKPTFAEEKYGFGFVRLPEGLDLNLNCTSSNDNECKKKPFGSNILPPVFSARINSRPSFSFLYGKVEIKAKLPKGNWIYPELYLTPKKYSYGSGYNSGEMRVAFTVGNHNLNNELSGGLILGADQTGRTFAMKKFTGNVNWSDDFHVYTLEWYPDRVTLAVDGNIYGQIYPPPAGYGNVYKSDVAEKWRQGDVLAPFDKEMVLTIGVGAGGHTIPDVDGKPYKNEDAKEMLQFYLGKNTWVPSWKQGNEMIVEYVKVFAV